MTEAEETIGVNQEEDLDMNHLEPQEEIPDQGATTDQDQAPIQDQDPIDQDLTVTIDLAAEIGTKNRPCTNVAFMEKKLRTIQQ